MTLNRKSQDRETLLADIAELYYKQGKTQAEISKTVGITRSAISRMLTEARNKGIVEIQINRPIQFEPRIERSLQAAFDLANVKVLKTSLDIPYPKLQTSLGMAAAIELKSLLKANMTIGVSWGTTVKSVVDSFPPTPLPNLRIVQLLGVLGSTRYSYSGQSLVETLALKFGGEGTYLYTPFMVENAETAALLKNDPSIKSTLRAGTQCDLAILGIGSSRSNISSLYQGGHISKHELDTIQRRQAVGNVNGCFFDIQGNLSNVEIHNRLVGISAGALLEIPIRFGTAGNPDKAEAILGALRGGFINHLVTDNLTAERLLKLAGLD